MHPIYITDYTLTTALGLGKKANIDALQQCRSGLTSCDFDKAKLDTYIGRVKDLEHYQLPNELIKFNCRNNYLAHMALQQDNFLANCYDTISRYGKSRVAILLGTTTSGFLQAEHAYQHLDENNKIPKQFHYEQTTNLYASVDFIRHYLQLEGPAFAINTACSSSAKVFISAYRMLQANICDAVIVGGVDSLCLNTLYGFHSLELLSSKPCQPCDQHRSGLSIGEAAGFIILERTNHRQNNLILKGYGESCDAHHISTPHPEGKGAQISMQNALEKSSLKPTEINYINMHGTASQANDKSEDFAINKIFDKSTLASSTKGWTGHTLGAAGAIEAIFSLFCVENNFVPGCLNTYKIDENFVSNITLTNEYYPIKNVLTNSFGFGGNNCSLVFGK